ncbi:MAG: hypothetical protein ACJAU6_000637 [Alphaproteobacteria bacterium]|jgi:hypothetical protein
MKVIVRLFAGISMLWATAAISAERDIEDFYGEFVGRSVADTENGVKARDISIAIKSVKRGFSFDWTTVSERGDGTVKKKSYSIQFRKTKRANIFKSAMQKDVFGGLAPMNPMKGDPYVWARIHDDTLSVYAMHVIEDGTYEMQVYHRTLTSAGMDLKFSRYREGKSLKAITGSLKKVSK